MIELKVLLLSKDFRDGEGISEYTKSIAEQLVSKGHRAAVVSFEDGSDYSVDEDVEVYRVPVHFDGNNIYNWSMVLNNELKRQAVDLFDDRDFDIIHANDWTSVPGGVSLAKHLEKPLVVTFHSTENERGFEGEHAEMISELEWQGSYEAEKIFVTKEATRDSLIFDFEVPEDKIELIDPYSDGWREKILKQYQGLLKQEKEKIRP